MKTAWMIAGILLLAAVLLTVWRLHSEGHERRRAVKKENLTLFTYSRSGDMLGSLYKVRIEARNDGTVLLSELSAASHEDLGTIKEYQVEGELLKKIAKICRKYRMDRWVGRNFSKAFVADGASYRYSFRYGETEFSFSAQVYPARYRQKLVKIEELFRQDQSWEPLPALILPEGDEGRFEKPTPGLVKLKVERYFGGSLDCCFINGLDRESALFRNEYRLFNAETGEELPLEKESYICTRSILPGEFCCDSVRPKELLPAGRYRLEAEERTAEFEIGQSGGKG